MGYGLAWARACGAALLMATAACGDDGITNDPSRVGQEELVLGTLRNRVTITMENDVARIRSVIRNEGTAAASITLRECGLDVDPNLPLAGDSSCGAYSSLVTISPGDSVVMGDERILETARASIRVRHMLRDDGWVTVALD